MNLENKVKYDELSPSLQIMIDNKLEESEFINHDNNMIRHIIQEERNYWNSIEQICKEYAKNYTDTEITKLKDWTKKKIQDEVDRAKKEESDIWDALSSLKSEMNRKISNLSDSIDTEISNVNKDMSNNINDLKNKIGIHIGQYKSIARSGSVSQNGIIFAHVGCYGGCRSNLYINEQEIGYSYGEKYVGDTLVALISKGSSYRVTGSDIGSILFIPFE